MRLAISLAPETLFKIGSIPISNSFFWSCLVSGFLILAVILFSRFIRLRPGRWQNVIELLIVSAYDFVENTIGDRKKAQRVFPLVFAMFFFVLICNLLTFIPGQAAVSIETAGGVVPLFRSIIADYGLIFIITLVSVVITQVVAIAVTGPLAYIGRFFNFRSPLVFFLGIMDLIGELAKVMSLSFRLFGNMFAGEVLTAVMLFLFPFFLPLPFAFLGILTAIVQPFVFAVLTLVFISMAANMGTEVLETGEAK